MYVVCSLKLGSSLNVRSFGLFITNIDISQPTIEGSWGKSLADDVRHVVAYWQAM